LLDEAEKVERVNFAAEMEGRAIRTIEKRERPASRRSDTKDAWNEPVLTGIKSTLSSGAMPGKVV
jgi:hypothetical protein